MSDINYENINENFPIAGEDNDTQVFRDNFNTIRQSLQTAKTEVGDLQVQTAKLIDDNDFNLNTIENAATKNIREHFYIVTVSEEDTQVEINYANGSYQVVTFNADSNIRLVDFPNATEIQQGFVGKMRLELYGAQDSAEKVITFPAGDGAAILDIKKNYSTWLYTEETFWAVDGSGNVSFTIPGGYTDPILIDVWRRGDTLFLRHLGEFY